MDTAVVIVVASLVIAALAFLLYGLRVGIGAPEKAEEPPRFTAQATLAEMRRDGAGLPSGDRSSDERDQGQP